LARHQKVSMNGTGLVGRPRRARVHAGVGRKHATLTVAEAGEEGSSKIDSTLRDLELMGIIDPTPKEDDPRRGSSKPAQKADKPAADAAAKDDTIRSLDAALGVKEEPQAEGQGKKESGVQVTVSDDVIKEIIKADQLRSGEKAGEKDEAKINEMLENVKNLSEQERMSEQDAARLQSEFESLVKLLAPEAAISKEDIDIMKNKVFGFNTFWVTGNEPYQEGGWVFRGNLRAPREEVYAAVEAQMTSEFGEKYELMMVEEQLESDLEASDNSGPRGPRVSFVISPMALMEPEATTNWQVFIAIVLAGLTVITSIQLGLVAEVTRLPPETLAWFSSPDNVNSGAVPPGLENFDTVEYFDRAMPITMGVLAAAGAHELGHVIAGLIRQVKLGPAFFIPNGALGTLGAVTQFKSRLRHRSQLFDVAAAGPIAGGLVGAYLFVNGLAMSVGGDPSDLLPVPAGLLQGSLALGALTQLVLHVDAGKVAEVAVHPSLIAGWCVLTTTAFNLLPVGALDGGRMVQAAYGRRSLGLTGLFTYIGLALGLLGGALSLPFGIFLVLTQRTPERDPRDGVSGVGQIRNSISLAAILFAVLVLLPLGVDPTDPMLSDMPPLF